MQRNLNFPYCAKFTASLTVGIPDVWFFFFNLNNICCLVNNSNNSGAVQQDNTSMTNEETATLFQVNFAKLLITSEHKNSFVTMKGIKGKVVQTCNSVLYSCLKYYIPKCLTKHFE